MCEKQDVARRLNRICTMQVIECLDRHDLQKLLMLLSVALLVGELGDTLVGSIKLGAHMVAQSEQQLVLW